VAAVAAVAVAASMGIHGVSAAARAEPRRWSSPGARVLDRGRWELGIVRGLHLGAAERVELSLHPMPFFVLPHLEAKVAWGTMGRWSIASRHRVAYPTFFLQIVSREGAGGLLPRHTDVPAAIELTSDAVASLALARDHELSFAAGVTVAPRFTSGQSMPLLDFPFLYPRFAALETFGTAHAIVTLDGSLAGERFAYELELRGYYLPLDPIGWSFEQALALGWRPARGLELQAGARFSLARYPIGTRFHYLPFVDVAFAW